MKPKGWFLSTTLLVVGGGGIRELNLGHWILTNPVIILLLSGCVLGSLAPKLSTLHGR